MIATSIAMVREIDWSAIRSPTDVEQVLQETRLLLRSLRAPRGVGEGTAHLWLLVGSSRETGERLMLEFARGPFVTDPHGYPQNGRAYGQRVWVLRGKLQFLCSGAAVPIEVVQAGESRDHPGGIWHRTFVEHEALVLIHQPHGSQLHPWLPA